MSMQGTCTSELSCKEAFPQVLERDEHITFCKKTMKILHVYMLTCHEMIRRRLDLLIVVEIQVLARFEQHHIDLGAMFSIIEVLVLPVSSPTVRSAIPPACLSRTYQLLSLPSSLNVLLVHYSSLLVR